MGEDFLWKSKLNRFKLEKVVSEETIQQLPKDFGSVVASISCKGVCSSYGRHNGHCESIIRFNVGLDPKDGGPRQYSCCDAINGPEFGKNEQWQVVDKAKRMLHDKDYMTLLLLQYTGFRSIKS